MALLNSNNENDENSIEINDECMVNTSQFSSESIPGTDSNNQEASGGLPINLETPSRPRSGSFFARFLGSPQEDPTLRLLLVLVLQTEPHLKPLQHS